MKNLQFDSNVYVIISTIGHLFLNNNISVERNALALKLLKIVVEMKSPSLKLKLSTLGALANAYYFDGHLIDAIKFYNIQLDVAHELSEFFLI